MLLNGVQEVLKFTYATNLVDMSYGTSGSFRGATTNGVVCNLRFPTNIRIHGGKLYVADYYDGSLFKFDISTGACDWKKSFSYPRNLAIHGNIMYASHRGGLYTHNLSTDTTVNCSTNVGSVGSSYSTVDSSG